jgi:hypothetical protein
MALRVPSCVVLAATLLSIFSPGVARAHWCDDLWDSSYNIVVKPASDTVNVPADGSATLDLYVQNNMGYALENFQFRAEAPGYEIDHVRTVPTVANHLMPGETLKYTLTIRKSGGATLDVTSLEFYVNFGGYADGYSQRQDAYYQDNPVMVKMEDGGLSPPSIDQISGNSQARYLQNSANADYHDLSTGLDELLDEVQCYQSGVDSTHYDSLWAAAELAIRGNVLGDDRRNTLRERLRCSWDHPSLTFKAFSAFVLGYLGPDGESQVFLAEKAGSSDPEEIAVAESALCIMGQPAQCDSLPGRLSGYSPQAQMVAAAALRITGDESDDPAVESELIERARWVYFGEDEGVALMASHLVNLVAWNQRGWARNAADTGLVSFYPISEDTESGGSGGGGGGGGGGGTAQASSGCGYGAGATSLLTLLLLFAVAARRRRT